MRLLVLTLLASGCFWSPNLGGQEGSAQSPQSPTEADADTDADTDVDADTDADTDTDTDFDPSRTGIEVFQFRLGSLGDSGGTDQGAPALNCDLVFSLSASEAEAADCEGCAFAFAVSYELEPDKSSDDGLCETLGYLDGFGGVYAYHPDYEDYGPSWLLSDDDTWVLRGAAVLKDGQLTYDYSIEDAETYYSYSRSGRIEP